MIATLRERSRTLTFRIAALLALALLPVGIISVATTYQLLNRAEEDLADTLLALTSDAAQEPEAAIRTATGVAKTLVSLVPVLRANGWPCEGPLASLLRDTPELSLVAYVQRDGNVACASSGQGNSLAERPMHNEFTERPGPRVKFNVAPSISNVPVIIVSLPVVTDGDYDGYVVASIPHRKLTSPIDTTGPEQRPLELVTFNAEGDVLTSSSGMEDVGRHLPLNRSLAALAGGEEVAFVAETETGDERLFAVVPIVAGQVFALGSWENRSGALVGGMSWGASMFFPLMMWVVSLLVAFYAVQRMVIRPTRNLRARMLAFMRSRKLVEPKPDPSVPAEIRDMEETWMRLAENILHDEAELYDTIHQRTVLLKEVHHRVKNNLQLIVSIVGMKMRKANSPTIKNALSDIQQRVMSIARVHQNLYETSTAERVRVNELLDAIVRQILSSATEGEVVATTMSFDECEVYPDQAVPLSLAVSELVTNALKHLGQPENGENPRLTVRLDCEPGGDRGVITVVNTLGAPFGEGAGEESTGLGEQLVRAFVSQMDGKVTRREDEGEYVVEIEFPIQGFDDEIVPSDHTHPIVSRA
ncbi:histidine kinase dimerization/phosphoacceptor domain -containing protein [uncultured Maritimibacter sp.]|uniref:sensor histidine kinase n=1 Tax=uncultured Maritimibacter sp. TaxID=991866 RepID=UPI0026119FAF|nr:histidine kinase dimerization/phosphoacceptor domain -containing protein [uncultured Maritimibacter sp.]